MWQRLRGLFQWTLALPKANLAGGNRAGAPEGSLLEEACAPPPPQAAAVRTHAGSIRCTSQPPPPSEEEQGAENAQAGAVSSSEQ